MSAVKQVIAINENEATRPESTQAGAVPVPGEIGGTSSELVRALRRRLPDERRAITHHFSIAGQEDISPSACTTTAHRERSS